VTERLGFIYGLVDPRTDEVRYVGRAVEDPWYRYTRHLKDETDTYKGRWVRSLRNEGLKPKLVIIEAGVPESKINECECWWIASGKSWGWALTNGTRGGDGLVSPTDEVRARMSAAWVTRPPMSDETRAKLSAAGRGRVFTEEKRKKISESLRAHYTAEKKTERSRRMTEWWAERRRTQGGEQLCQ
jgi:hypothetical protein